MVEQSKTTIQEKIDQSETPEGHYPWDLPEFNRIARFFSALKEKEPSIESTKCKKCGTIQWPPRIICSNCLSSELDWIELPKTGKIVAFSNSYVGTIHGEKAPMIVAAIDLDNGLRLLSRISDSSYEEIRVGQRVRLKKTALVDGQPYWEFSPEK